MKDEPVESKRTINGVEWLQGSVSGEATNDNGNGAVTNLQILALIAKNPTDESKIGILVLSAEKVNFEQVNKEYFEPLIQSFKFK